MFATGGHKYKPGVETKWGEGIFLDLIEPTGEYVIGTPAGIVKSGCIKRMVRDSARDPTLFKAVVGQPWRLSPTSAPGTSTVELPTRLSVQPAVPAGDLPEPHGRAAEALPRRLYIRKRLSLRGTERLTAALGASQHILGRSRRRTTTSAGRGSLHALKRTATM